MSGLFEEFYYFAQHYSWIKEEGRAKEIFMKVLEKFAAKNISIVDVKQVRNFLQKEIYKKLEINYLNIKLLNF